jgi:hypothetical protein
MLIAYYTQPDGRIYRADDVTNIDKKVLNRRMVEYNRDSAPVGFVRLEDVSDDSLTAYLFRRHTIIKVQSVYDVQSIVDSLKDALMMAEDLLDSVKCEVGTE